MLLSPVDQRPGQIHIGGNGGNGGNTLAFRLHAATVRTSVE